MNKRSFKYAWVSFLHQGSCMVLSLVLHAASRQHVMQPFIQWRRWPLHSAVACDLLGCSCSMSVGRGTA